MAKALPVATTIAVVSTTNVVLIGDFAIAGPRPLKVDCRQDEPTLNELRLSYVWPHFFHD
jgi:hypothetical protein